MKVLNLGDLHIGVAKDDPWVQNIQYSAIKAAIEYSKQEGIKEWIQYGDWFDTRKAVTQECMRFAREIVNEIIDAGITVHVIIGNHDMHKKNKITPNSVSEILRGYSNIKIYEKPTTVSFDGVNIDLIPWMCDENTKEILEFVKNTNSDYCVGHWELNGFYFYKGMKSHGLEPDFLKGYKQVWSGHFHTISEAANVKYIGTPFTLTAGDENDPRGFWVFDTEDHSFDFFENPTCWHRKVYYPADNIVAEDLKDIAVRLVATESDKGLSKLESELEEVVYSLKIIIENQKLEIEESEEDISRLSLQELGNNFIEASKEYTDSEKESIKTIFKSLYIEAQNAK